MSAQQQDPAIASATHPCQEGHQYQPRFDMRVVEGGSQSLIYVQDICRQCGHVIKRPREDRGGL